MCDVNEWGEVQDLMQRLSARLEFVLRKSAPHCNPVQCPLCDAVTHQTDDGGAPAAAIAEGCDGAGPSPLCYASKGAQTDHQQYTQECAQEWVPEKHVIKEKLLLAEQALLDHEKASALAAEQLESLRGRIAELLSQREQSRSENQKLRADLRSCQKRCEDLSALLERQKVASTRVVGSLEARLQKAHATIAKVAREREAACSLLSSQYAALGRLSQDSTKRDQELSFAQRKSKHFESFLRNSLIPFVVQSKQSSL